MSLSDQKIIKLQDLLELKEAKDDDILIIQDEENTKKISFIDFILSCIKDNELPASYRLFSSEKVTSLLKEYQTWVETNTTGMGERIRSLENNSATKKILQQLVEELDENKIEMSDLEPIEMALDNKRDKSELLNADDWDISSDDYKIHLAQLSKEVIDTMAGDIPVNVSAAPEGGWGSSYIANNSIISTKLGNYYRYRGFVTEGSINDIIADGLYLIGPNVTDTVKHENDIGNEIRLLEVKRFGEAGAYINQTIDYYNIAELRPTYYRICSTAKLLTTQFEARYSVSDNLRIANKLLDDSYSNAGTITSGNLYDTTRVGSYYVKAGVINTPDITKDFLVDITYNGLKYIYRAIDITTSKCLVYMSLLYHDSSNSLVCSQWFKINDMNKSKFDGRRLNIFGDGISCGIGASAVMQTSYPYLLQSRYGFNVLNSAVGDATIGNYDDDIFKTKSVLKQISTTELNSNTDIVLIFAGTNDFTSEKADIGENDDETDNTFKGSINLVIKNILSKAPQSKLLLVTPMYRSRIKVGDDKNCDDNQINYKYLRDYSNAIEEIAKYNHIPSLNLLDKGMINKYNSTYYLNDGLYPNDNGHSIICDMIYDTLNKYY